MNDLISPRRANRGGWTRRLRVLFRLAFRKLARIELVDRDSHANPKTNPIRWIV